MRKLLQIWAKTKCARPGGVLAIVPMLTVRRRDVVMRRGGEIALAFLGALLICEIALRLASVQDGHMRFLFGKPWYYLVPFDVPGAMPEIAVKSGGPTAYRRYDPELGWTIAELGKEPPLYCSDARGFRCAERTYREQLSDVGQSGALEYDIVCIGDSFTHGDEVRYEDTWPYLLAHSTGLCVLNLGVGGYGIDQALWRYEESEAKTRLVLLGLIAGDLERATTQIYNFTSGGLKTKPIFQFDGDRVQVLNRPSIHGAELKREFALGSDSEFFRREWLYAPSLFETEFMDLLYLYRVPKSLIVSARLRKPPIYRTEGPRLNYCLRILKHMQRVLQSREAKLVIVLLGNNNTFGDRERIEDPWKLFKARLEAEGLDYISTAESLYELYRSDRSAVINRGGVHYTPTANRRVAEILAESQSIRTLRFKSAIARGQVGK